MVDKTIYKRCFASVTYAKDFNHFLYTLM
uniref:Uncharacterized protein n=1 Tax=Anguilla anguilla TaxID=7936 RepID=A0A0E9VDL1_ANGAN